MTEVRSVSSTGGEKGVKAQRHDLIPRQALDLISEVYAFGAEKYADHNWRKKYEWGKSYAALQRHLTAWWDGEDVDPESGLSHLGHAGFHIFALLTWVAEDGGGVENLFDDRWRTAFARKALEEAEPDPELILPILEIQDQVNAEWWRNLGQDLMWRIPDERPVMHSRTFEDSVISVEVKDASLDLIKLATGQDIVFAADPSGEIEIVFETLSKRRPRA